MAKKLDAEYYQFLEQIQAADFVLVELTLYLDTHPGDENAIQQFNQYSEYCKQLRAMFEPRYGPLLQYDIALQVAPGTGEAVLGHGRFKEETMWVYEKKLQYPVKVSTCNPD